MGIPLKPYKVKLFVAIMYKPGFNIQNVIETLEKRFGEREFTYGPVDFSWSEYYQSEMGDNLKKIYFNYNTLIDREDLPSIKLYTNDLEKEFSAGTDRDVNIDPGYIARDKFVLATTKDFYHRIYIGQGIYAEVTLHYRRGRYRFFSWTYPDYKEQRFFEYIEKARATLVKEIRSSD